MIRLKTVIAAMLLTVIAAFNVSAQTSRTTDAVSIVGETLLLGESETQYLAVTLANASDKFVGYQMDIILPDGMEIAYYEGEPDIYIDDTSLYPVGGRPKAPYHNINSNVNGNRITVMCTDTGGNRPFTNENGKTIDGKLFLFGVTTTPYLKPGKVQIELREIKFSNANATGTRQDSVMTESVVADNNCSITLKVSASSKFSTAILPFAVEQIPAGLEAYSCKSSDGEYLVLTKQQSIAAYTPYILYAENGYEGTLNGTVDASEYAATVTDGFITGTVVKQEITGGNGYYVMQNKGDGAMFYRVGDTPFGIPAGKCWLTIPQEMQGAAMFRLDVNTSIEEVTTDNTTQATYDLYGRRIQDVTRPGIYIVDRKKRVIK